MKFQKIYQKLVRKFYYYSNQVNQVEQARKFRLAYKFSEAESILASNIHHHQNNFFALAEMAEISFDQNHFAEAASRWEAAIQYIGQATDKRETYILKAAEAFIANRWFAKARLLVTTEKNISAEASLAQANCSLDNHQEWLFWVNRYLAFNGLNEIAPTIREFPEYINLTCSPKQYVNGQPKVSVIMSAYNSQDFIDFAIRSILDQSWKNLELVIIDDVSSDETLSIIAAHTKNDPRVKVIRNKVNVGTYASRNIALDQCTGEFVTTHDSDDWAHPDRIKIQTENLRSDPDLVGTLCKNVRLMENGKFELTPWGTYKTDRCCVSLMFRADLVKQVFGYWDSVRVSADAEMIDRIQAVLGIRAIKVLSQPLLFQLRRGKSLTTVPTTLGVSGRSSLARQQYKKSYQTWHKTINKNNCKVLFPQTVRRFDAPEEILSPLVDMKDLVDGIKANEVRLI